MNRPDAGRLTRHFLPPFGDAQLEKIGPHDVSKIIDRLLETPSEANHALVAVRGFFSWAERRRLVLRSPAALLQPPTKAVARARVLTDDELRRVLSHAIAGRSNFAAITQLLVFTGQRRGEIGALAGRMVDFDTKTITLPALLTKNKREHRFPFGPLAEAVLRTLPREGLLFPARGTDSAFSGWSKCKRQFDKECGVSDWTLHDLRRTFATGLAALGTPIHVTEKFLNHVSGTVSGVAAIYNRHAYLDEMRAAVEAWEKQLHALIEQG